MHCRDRTGGPEHRVSHRSRIAAAPFGAAAFLLFALLGCDQPAAPPGPPYLAIVTQVSILPGAVALDRLTYNVRELSGTYAVDERIVVSPTDTLILPVPAATYVVDLAGLPSSCSVRDGPRRSLVLTPGDNTGLIRYSVQCRSLLTVAVLTDGYNVDPSFLLRLRSLDPAAEPIERILSVGATDTVSVNGIPPGSYEVRLADVEPHCIVTSPGATVQQLIVDSLGGAATVFRVRCSDVARRPSILRLVGGYATGSGVFAITLTDPDRDIDGYTWDITDCRGNSLLPDGREKTRRFVRAGRAAAGDTVTIVGAYDIGLPSEALRGGCTAVRVFDFAGNSSPVVTQRLRPTGTAPVAVTFDARLIGTSSIATNLQLVDPDNDVVGLFVGVRLRDGTLSPPDGVPELGILDPAGFMGSLVPNIPTTARISWESVYAVIVWVIDAGGNALRVEDGNIFG